MLHIDGTLQKNQASYLVLVGLGHQLSQLLNINIDLINPHKQMHLAFDYRGKNYTIYADKKYPTAIQALFNCYGKERYFQEYNGTSVLNYFRSVMNKRTSFHSSHIYAFKEKKSGLVFKLHKTFDGSYFWIRLDGTHFNYNGESSEWALRMLNLPGIDVQEFENYESFVQWLYINK